MPHIHELARYKDKWQRDLTRSVLIVLAALILPWAVAGIIWSLI